MKRYRRPFPNTWWLEQRNYFLFMMREISSLFIGIYIVVLLLLIRSLDSGPEAYAAFRESLSAPPMVAFHIVLFLFALYQTTTTFNLTPKVIVVQLGERRVPGFLIAGAHYAGWLAVSTVLACILLKG